MTADPENLIWIDLEMTGLDTDHDRVIEIATVVTDKNLNVLGEGPVMAIHQSPSLLDAMDEWNREQHGQSGLTDRVIASDIDEAEAERATLEFLTQYIQAGKSPMCGNTICQDRRFLHRAMPTLEHFFHYRNLDVSSLKELVVRWRPDLVDGFKKRGTHRALDDIYESIDELRFYREHFLNV